jgi:hypothetical protein
VNVLLFNKFEGYLDWWREEDFKKPAREMCSTVCTVTKDRGTISTADVGECKKSEVTAGG